MARYPQQIISSSGTGAGSGANAGAGSGGLIWTVDPYMNGIAAATAAPTTSITNIGVLIPSDRQKVHLAVACTYTGGATQDVTVRVWGWDATNSRWRRLGEFSNGNPVAVPAVGGVANRLDYSELWEVDGWPKITLQLVAVTGTNPSATGFVGF